MDALDSTEERGQWVEGFRVGCRGNPPRDAWPGPKASGHAFGIECWNSAQEFRARKASAGAASADARRARSGTAQPNRGRTDSEQCSSDVRALIEQDSNISRIQNPESISEKTEAKKRAKVFVPPTIEEATEYAASVGFAGVAQWFAYYETNGWKVGKNKMTDWKAAIRYWKSKDGAAFAAPTLDEWMQAGEQIAMSNPTHARQRWPRDLCRSAYHGAAANGWRGVTDWKGKILSECLRWVGNENGRART